MRQIPSRRDRAERCIREGRPGLAIIGGHVHAGVGADEQDRMISQGEIGGVVGDGVFPVSHDGCKGSRELIRDRVRVCRGVVVLTKDRIRQVEDIAGDVDPSWSGIGRRGDRIGYDVHTVLGHGVGFVATTGRAGDDRLDLRAIQTGGDIDPIVVVPLHRRPG